ncbi:binding-protein-dependent transport systems inner membrane component [Paenibacillus algicola]|uniref:Binding-protein-dependent transport systems inner membrane component n=1 Tax=Paenibacillus algicola TaxID=2565926 RepID=A0A4P8XGF7_9BACL|nr:binding-protein-dependent transport systems inner membrane component [Paenibacillus algicola]
MSYLKRALPVYIMILPGMLFFLIFKYIPMFGIVIAFKDYNPFRGFLGSDWVGLDQFVRLFTERDFMPLLYNTLMLSLMDIIFFFPAPIIMALLLNEVRLRFFKRSVQTILYAPHFLSWVVIVGITVVLFSTEFGGINQLLKSMGLPVINILTNADAFRWTWLIQNIWQGVGWGTIIFLAALSSVDPSLYEAASIDGASRLKQIWHVTLPALSGVIIILFILRLGNFMDIGFEHIYLLQNPLNQGVSDVFDTYVYRQGIVQGDFSYSTAVGIFKSIVGLVLIIGANTIVKRAGQEGVY